MSIRVMNMVWTVAKDVQENELLVFLALADWANDEGECWPRIKQIASKTRVAERTVQYALKKLEAKGYLSIERGQGRGIVSQYQINLSKLFEMAQKQFEEAAQKKGAKVAPIQKKVQAVHKKGASDDIKKVQLASVSERDTSINTSDHPSSPSISRTRTKASSEADTRTTRASKQSKPKQVDQSTECPEQFELSDHDREWAFNAGWRGNMAHLDHTTETFLSDARAKGKRFKNWKQAWQTWIRKSITWGEDVPKGVYRNGNGNGQQRSPEAAQRAPTGNDRSARIVRTGYALAERRKRIEQLEADAALGRTDLPALNGHGPQH